MKTGKFYSVVRGDVFPLLQYTSMHFGENIILTSLYIMSLGEDSTLLSAEFEERPIEQQIGVMNFKFYPDATEDVRKLIKSIDWHEIKDIEFKED